TAGMLPDERTLAEALKEAGYDTALVGKWHLGNWYPRQLPLARGFDHHYGLYGALVSYYGKVRGTYYDWHRDGEPVQEEGYTTDLLAREVERLLAARESARPFFYYVAFNAVHGPDEAPADLAEKYRMVYEKLPGEIPARQRSLWAIKSAMLESMDMAVGRILAALQSHGVRDNTLVVFFNDNGGRQENPPFRGGKGETYEGGVRVPCIFHWPGRVPAGGTVEGMAHVVDLYPTLLKLAGGSLEQKLPLDGIDLWNAVTRGDPSPRSEVVNSLPGDDVETGVMSIRQGPWKLVGQELYHIEDDPTEAHDLAKEHPEICRRLQARLEQLVTQRRPAEQHERIPDKPLLVLGQDENAHPPGWLKPYLESLPEEPKPKRTKQ
ncbi:MAG: sulfatase-like hydrolase/transferase, partial [Planctomycetota bacterium]